MTNVLTKIATLRIYIAVYEAYRFTEWSMSSIPLWIRALVLYDLCYYWAQPHVPRGHCHVGPACGAPPIGVPATRPPHCGRPLTGALPGWVFYLASAVLSRYPMADAGDRGLDRPAVPVLGAH
ncbi:MAG: hypothetical protein IPG06_23850 [Haliea sp.]|nr:hypothetical protein [Haliea sp.]